MRQNLALVLLALAVLGGAALYFRSARLRTQPVDLGVPVYPGARFADNLTVGETQAVVLETRDRPEQVVAFYRERLAGRARILESSKGAAISVEARDARRLITVTPDRESGRTRITVAIAKRRAEKPVQP